MVSLPWFRLLLVVLFVSAGAVVHPRLVDAQETDVIRGRVTGTNDVPVENVRVTVTSLSGDVTRAARTDRNGRFTVTFPDGDGDYIVSFAGIGYASKQFEVKRTADQDILIADAKLVESAQVVDPVDVISRDRVGRNDASPDVSGGDRSLNNALLPADQLGDLAAAAASVPGVTFIPGEDGDPNGYAVLGLGTDQNNTTLNGMEYGGSTLPRDAAVSASLTTTPYDVSRGGFSGAQTALRTRSGSNVRVRGMSLNLDAPQLQWTDRAAQALGAEYSNLSLGGITSGPIAMNKAFYNLSYQLGRRANDLHTLLNTAPVGLESAGIAPDSVTRLLSILGAQRVPLSVGPLQESRIGDQGALFGSLDFNPPSSMSGSAFNVSFGGTLARQSPVSGNAAELPAHSGDRTNWGGSIQARQSGYYGILLSETSVGINVSRSAASPYLILPSGRVRVTSALSDGSSSVQNLSFGGSPSLSALQSARTANFLNQLSWFSTNNKHRLKLATELHYDASTQDLANNLLGTFAFNSLGDLDAKLPASFTRQLTSPQRTTDQFVGGLSLGDSYRSSDNLQVQYGVRLDGNHFLSTPNADPVVQEIFGVRNSDVPNRLYVSPRIGFSWSYGAPPQIAGFFGAARGPRGIVRGGVGMFQNTPSTSLVGAALDNTGLSSAIQQLNCVGAAAPTPDWALYIADPGAVPDRCADGTTGTLFASSAPNVTLFANNYVAPRSLRSNLQWNGPVFGNRFSLQANATYSLNLNQPGAVDLNFSPISRFTLVDEGGRPVFVQASSIVPSTGAVASRDARVSQLFSRVIENRSDLRSESRQVTFQLSPTVMNPAGLGWNLAYVFSDVREQIRGFTSTVGNPLDITSDRSAAASRHQIQYSLTYNFFSFVTVSWGGSFRSGTLFTPMIAGDANGDGYANDRAFIIDPAHTTDPVLGSGMESLLTGGSRAARECLAKQLGRLAARNSCHGPWTSSATMSMTLDPVKFRMPHRATLNLSLSNPLGAADLLIHGSDHLRGWGQPVNEDQSLLYVHGFDPQAERYTYEVNQRFGTNTAAFTGFRTPVTLTALVRFDIGPTRERQNLSQQLDRGRGIPGTARYTEATFRLLYGSNAVSNPLATILRSQDTLQLTGAQSDSLTALNRSYGIRMDSIWTPVAKYLAQLPDRYDEGEAYGRYRIAREASIDLLIAVAPDIQRLLTPDQRRKLPASVLNYLDPRFLAAIRPGTGSYLGIAGATAAPNVVIGNGGNSVQIVK